MLTSLFLVVAPLHQVHAQEVTCPTNVLMAMSRAAAACVSMGPDQGCYGSGQVITEVRDQYPLPPLTQPGERIALDALSVIRTESEGDTWSTAYLNLHGSFNRALGQRVAIWLIGSTILANNARSIPEAEVIASGNAIIRSQPDQDEPIVAQVAVNTPLIANGYSDDAAWVRVFIPNLAAIGWVSTDSLDFVPFTDLALIDDPEAGYASPFRFMYLISGTDDALCADAPQSGMMIQSANGRESVYFLLNNVILDISGTIFVQASAGGTLDVNVIDGFTSVTTKLAQRESIAAYTLIPPGSRIRVPLDERGLGIESDLQIEPFDAAALAPLPISILPFRVAQIPQALPTEQIAEQIAEQLATRQLENATPAPTLIALPTVDMSCRREMRDAADLFAGPGTFFEVVGRLGDAALVVPEVQATDPDGVIWWQLISGSWVAADNVRETGTCDPVPDVPIAPPSPTNTIGMETCEPDSGPIRVGQQVTFRFTPPGFATMGEAIAAVRVDPGAITVDADRLSISVTDPLQVSRLAVVRTFYGTWTAVTGTHRAIGQRLSYSVVCDFTVPAE
ncbi:MAG: SH3 domain-containing protein [Chloroflexota bacterium]|nr:SH3 domain-containing protein [Chloroflexota bacterium]